ncbi:MAG TPA: hypothetical protein VNT26_22375, partial [Candidatus Sulfotelmatobacter sp.]|nr:hypothetical protein [Candidatus Sulfotelmatobacter sp.]
MECITQDPRLDSQVESRSDYYAALLLEKGLPIRPLAQHLRKQKALEESDQNTALTVDTLGQLAIRGHQGAADTLYDYILWGQWEEVPLYELLNNGSPELCRQIVRAIEQRLPSDEALEEELAWFDLKQAPWTALARPGSRIAKLAAQPRKLKGLAKLQGDSPPNLTALPISELLQIADKDNCHLVRKAIVQVVTPADQELLVSSVSAEKPYQAEVALTGLACLAPPSLLGWLRDCLAVNPNIPPRLQYRARQVILEFPPELTLSVG